MSVVVRMEMPHDGLCDLEQTLIYGLGTYCAVNGERCNYSDTGTRPDYCPIICQLPEGHGRLVDADALVDDIRHNLWDYDTVDGITPTTVLKQTVSDIRNCPTIVSAERSET